MSVSGRGWAIVSLGLSCQTSHQLRDRLAGMARDGRQFQVDAHYFDYIVTPLPTLLNILDGRFPELSGPGDMDIVLEQPFWTAHRIFFPHNFRRPEMVGPIDIEGTYERSAAKISHLRQKFLALDNADSRLMFVIGNAQSNIGYFSQPATACPAAFWFSRRTVEALRRSLLRRYGSRFRRLVVVESDQSFSGAWQLPDVSRYNSGALEGPVGAQWKGDDAFWHTQLATELRRQEIKI